MNEDGPVPPGEQQHVGDRGRPARADRLALAAAGITVVLWAPAFVAAPRQGAPGGLPGDNVAGRR